MRKARASLITLFLLTLLSCQAAPGAVNPVGWVPVGIFLFAIIVFTIIIGRKVF